MSSLVTVAVPTLNAGASFAATLEGIAAQQIDPEIELLVCDSGSADGTVALAGRHGARVIEIPRARFSHGGTRNLLMSQARGTHVAFLTQDAVPTGPDWLAALLRGFDVAPAVALVYGPYMPRPGASLSVRRELTTWFGSLSPEGGPRVDALDLESRRMPAAAFYGPLGFFTDANGCVLRAAWQQVPFRSVAYAEDHLLAQDMLRAGFVKVYAPDAAVVHSHEYSPVQWLRRSFDETRGVAEIYEVAPGSRWRDATRNLRGSVGGDLRFARAELGLRGVAATLGPSLAQHGARACGAVLGGRATRLPSALARRLSLEGRA